MSNLCLLTDSYKQSHWKQYPPNTSRVYSYFESRGGKWDEMVFFGLQYYLKEYLSKPVTMADVDEAEEIVDAHMGAGTFNRKGWRRLVEKHGGKPPLRIKAVPEGSVIPTRNILMSVENTDDEFYWLTNFVETLLVQVWYPCTVATQSREMKKIIFDNLMETGDATQIDFKLHDFGFRGVTTPEHASVGGAAHLVNFKGTDTMAGLMMARNYYGEPMAGFSIPASEHSTITSWGENGEVDAMRNMLEQYPTGLVACVSDSFDIYRACRNYWGEDLKDAVMAREGTLVVRPDSGYPPEIVCNVLEILADKFGYTKNEKGYKVLDPHVRVIQGDGIDYEMLQSILNQMRWKGWSGDNIAFGSGGGLLQKVNRDTLKFAFKCSNVTINGQDRIVFKDPATDKGKVSKKGYLKLIRNSDSYTTEEQCNNFDNDELQVVFLNGDLLNEQSFRDIRGRARV